MASKVPKGDTRLTFQEQMKLVPLPDRFSDGKIVKRYMSQRAALLQWIPINISLPKDDIGAGKVERPRGRFAYGGHVYGQAGMAASRTFADTRANSASSKSKKQFGIHTMHGYFSEAGHTDRPFIYEVTTIAYNPSFQNLLVTVKQPTRSSTNSSGDHFLLEDAEIPLGPVCFSAVVSFRPAGISQLDAQEPSAQARFADILNSRPASDWDPPPLTDVASVVAAMPTREVGNFPVVDMRKVDLTAFNEGKPLHERRELLLYRLLAPLPASDPDAHIMTHAFEADRNGLLMVGNHAGFGFDFGRAASLSYSFVVHTNPVDAVMNYGENEWWIQEACFPRVEAGRGIIMSKIWSPAGVHVATEYQDGIIRRALNPGEVQGKL